MAERFELAAFAYAHRGLWRKTGPSENSLEAFLLAAEHGLGIEFDVRPAADGAPIIFHDPLLDRMTDQSGVVEARTSEDLIGLPLKGGGEIIDLKALLDVWPDHLPLLCELKIDGSTDPAAFAARVATLIDTHKGCAAMMSFSARAVASVPMTIMRGQLISLSNGDRSEDLTRIAKSKVDYFACHTDDAANPSLQAARSNQPLVTWTVKSEAQCRDLSGVTDSQIFEGFDPGLAKRLILNR
ncbi:MAG: hypothetical protein NXH72_06735 [Hyphomonadaceae bacterium]|nr:hypothetical protein [Hyphomonadaceae bacterium]